MPDRYRQYLPLAISAGLHLVLLIITMLYYLPLMKREPWYEVSWGEPVVEEQIVEEVPEPAAEQASLPMQSTPVKPVVRQAPPSVRPSAPLNPPKAEDIGPPRLSESEVVEAPVYTPTEPAIKAPPSLRSNPQVTDALRQTVSGIPANNSPGSVESDLEGGKLIRTDTKHRTHSFGDYGEVKLSFSVDMSARLIASSIRVIQSQNSKFDAEAISVLKDMTFSFRGRPDPDKPYQITIKFSP
jgi:TonB family protein